MMEAAMTIVLALQCRSRSSFSRAICRFISSIPNSGGEERRKPQPLWNNPAKVALQFAFLLWRQWRKLCRNNHLLPMLRKFASVVENCAFSGVVLPYTEAKRKGWAPNPAPSTHSSD